MIHLVVGGRSIAGQATISVLRTLHPNQSILATCSSEGDVTGADEVIEGVDLHAPDAATKLLAKLPPDSEVGSLTFCPAFGAVGFPIEEATQEQIDVALAFCVKPFQVLTEALNPKIAIGFSSFYWLPACIAGYGAMAYAKRALEELAFNNPAQYKVIRAGFFRSPSSKAIALLLYRTFKTNTHPMVVKLHDQWKASGEKLLDFFEDHVLSQEAALLNQDFETPHALTTSASIERALKAVLQGTSEPFYNVIGDWEWETNNLPDIPT